MEVTKDKNNGFYSETVPMKEKLAFGAADFFGGGAQALITAIYMVYLTMNGVPIALAGVIVAISKIWDAISDPIMGIITDNTRSKWGRRKPYLVAGGFFVIIAFGLLFLPLYKLNNIMVKFSIYLFAYIFYSTVATMITVPYYSLSTEISSDYYEKTKINTIRLYFSMVSSAISATVPIMLIERLQEGNLTLTNFSLIMTFIFGMFYCVPLILCGLMCKERLPIPDKKTKFSLKSFLRPLKVKAFVYLLIIYLCAFSCIDIISTNIVYFAKYGINFNLSAFLLLVVIMVSYTAMMPLHAALMKKGVTKTKLIRIGIPLYILGVAALTLLGNSVSDYVILGFCVVIGLGMSGCQMMPWIIFPDVIDVAELKLNDRPTGSFSGMMTFIRKTTSAIAIALSSFVLQSVDFIEPVADESGKIPEIVQPASAVWGLRLVILCSVAVLITIVYFYSKKLKLSPDRSCKIKQFIDLQAAGHLDSNHLSNEEMIEYEAIKKELF